MLFSVKSCPPRRTLRRVAMLAVAGLVVGYAAEAGAIDRSPFKGGFVSDARPGYGAERPRSGAERQGYGAEREYYGAENAHSGRGVDNRDRHARYRSEGSVIEFGDDDELAEDDGVPLHLGGGGPGVYPGFGGSAQGSFMYFGDAGPDMRDGVDLAAATDARVIDVAAERLDRQPIGPSGISVSYSGATKIIRIASGGVAPSTAPARSGSAPALEPWSDAWSRYCKRAHPGFDPERGTFSGADGAERFCTGD